MHEIYSLKRKVKALVHFHSEELRGSHIPYYQVQLGPNSIYSPTGDFIRFDCTVLDSKGKPESEIHGWKRLEDLVIDEILEKVEELAEVC